MGTEVDRERLDGEGLDRDMGEVAKQLEAPADLHDGEVLDAVGDIVIVGGGPAGLSTWLHLYDLDPRLATRCIVIDAATYPREKLCGGGVTWPGDLQLEMLDAAVDVPAVPIHRIEFRFGPRPLRLVLDDAMRIVRRSEFDHVLARLAADRGLVVHAGIALRQLEATDGRVHLQTSRGDDRARLVVGADGAQSTVRVRAGLSTGCILSRIIKVVSHSDLPDDEAHPRDTVVFDFGPVAQGLEGYVWHFPCLEAGLPCIDHGVFDSRVCRHRPRADLASILGVALAEAGVTRDSGAWRAHPVRPYTRSAARCGCDSSWRASCTTSAPGASMRCAFASVAGSRRGSRRRSAPRGLSSIPEPATRVQAPAQTPRIGDDCTDRRTTYGAGARVMAIRIEGRASRIDA